MFPLAIIAVLALVDVVALVAGGSPLWFNLLFTLGLLWGAYWFLWLLISELSLSGESIVWRTPLRSGRVRIVDIRRIRPGQWFTNGMEIIEMNDGGCLRVMGGTGFRMFCDALHRRRSDMPIQLSFQTQLLEGIFRSRRNRPPGP
jgi:hypothetical protein